jgi:hypothetical protein
MKHIFRLAMAALASAVVSVNVLAFMQARAMTRFAETGERTRWPEQLSVLDRLTVLVLGVNIPPGQSTSELQPTLIFLLRRIVLRTATGRRLKRGFSPAVTIDWSSRYFMAMRRASRHC